MSLSRHSYDIIYSIANFLVLNIYNNLHKVLNIGK